MRKLFTIISLFFITSIFAEVNEFYGSWQTDNVVYTFTEDSLYIDEIGNEGDCYKYSIDANKVVAVNSLGDTISFMINLIDTSDINIVFNVDGLSDSFNLRKIYDYDYEHFGEY